MKKLLVANRSEIACRIFQTAKEMGLHTVALSAPGDEEGRHLTFADEVISVPSYLEGPAILEAAKTAGVHLIHPGYGFLSERAGFARGAEAAGFLFLGPKAETMEAMGEKIASKLLAEKTGVPTLPWKELKPGEDLKKEAKKIGFPLLLKASSGGGGKGMRKVESADELEEAAAAASREAKAAFGEGSVFLERYLEKPRHIEIQVFGDGKGGGIHLYERECSLQRRHQKVWEEAPALRLAEKTRKGLTDCALKLVKAVSYRSAGTLEFLVTQTGEFFFLEMNTRLQVEHPVTECITGVDLVRMQIELALSQERGAKAFKLPTPETPRGHSIEVRVYAEDPSAGFIPSPGRIERLIWPSGPGIRVDSGIEEGQTITPNFDPMLAKLIVWAETRELAVRRLRVALQNTAILGLHHNLAFLQALAEYPEIERGEMDIHQIERILPELNKALDPLTVSLFDQLLKRGTASGTAGLSNQTNPSPWSRVQL